MKYAMFIGRWQPFHDGHKWLVDQQLSSGKNVLLAIRDVPPNMNQPFYAEEVKEMVELVYRDHGDRVKCIIIPDIDSVNYGRGVGYEVIEHKPNPDVIFISATNIREKIRLGDSSWKKTVDPSIHEMTEKVIKSRGF